MIKKKNFEDSEKIKKIIKKRQGEFIKKLNLIENDINNMSEQDFSSRKQLELFRKKMGLLEPIVNKFTETMIKPKKESNKVLVQYKRIFEDKLEEEKRNEEAKSFIHQILMEKRQIHIQKYEREIKEQKKKEEIIKLCEEMKDKDKEERKKLKLEKFEQFMVKHQQREKEKYEFKSKSRQNKFEKPLYHIKQEKFLEEEQIQTERERIRALTERKNLVKPFEDNLFRDRIRELNIIKTENIIRRDENRKMIEGDITHRSVNFNRHSIFNEILQKEALEAKLKDNLKKLFAQQIRKKHFLYNTYIKDNILSKSLSPIKISNPEKLDEIESDSERNSKQKRQKTGKRRYSNDDKYKNRIIPRSSKKEVQDKGIQNLMYAKKIKKKERISEQILQSETDVLKIPSISSLNNKESSLSNNLANTNRPINYIPIVRESLKLNTKEIKPNWRYLLEKKSNMPGKAEYMLSNIGKLDEDLKRAEKRAKHIKKDPINLEKQNDDMSNMYVSLIEAKLAYFEKFKLN